MALERDNRESLIQKYIKIFLVVSGYWIVSILTVFINKTLLSEIDLNAPMFIALYQTLITALICFMKKGLAKVFPKHFSFPDTNVWNVKTMKTILPVSLMFTMMIAMNNLCLKYVSVAFYYIGRGKNIQRMFVFLWRFFTSLQIKYTSALTHNISGTAKACAQTVLATYWYQETKSIIWWCSNFVVLFGSAGYARVKQLDMERKHKENVAYQKTTRIESEEYDYTNDSPDTLPKVAFSRYKTGSDILMGCNNHHPNKDNITWEFKHCENNYKGIHFNKRNMYKLGNTDGEWKKLNFNKMRKKLEIKNATEENIGLYRCLYNESVIKIYVVDVVVSAKYNGPPPEVLSLIPSSNSTILSNTPLNATYKPVN
ncbi:hypothetical protein MTP99_017277 [Tenebrio molitor]|nr:hypothetical protein MTP99_017277 [Tenebrio molitor]